MGWLYGLFANQVAAAGKKEYGLPMYMNAQLPALFEQAGEFGANSADFLLARAELFNLTNDPRAALEDAERLLKSPDATYVEVSAAARLILKLSPESVESIVDTSAFQRLDTTGQRFVANEFFQSRSALPVAVKILSPLTKMLSIFPMGGELLS